MKSHDRRMRVRLYELRREMQGLVRQLLRSEKREKTKARRAITNTRTKEGARDDG